jgi:polyisoprenoid-binding protein YceI
VLSRISTMRGRSWLVVAGFLLVGCAPEVQRAALVPAYPEVKAEASSPLASTESTKKLVFRSPHARVHVFSSDALNGDHHLLFAPVRGSYRIDPSGRAKLHMEVGMRGIRAEEGWIASFASRMLAVHEHPKTVMDLNVEPIENEPDQRDVKGNITLRGVERGIHFRATVRDEPDGVRFRAVFDMSRSAFGIRAKPEEGDSLIRDDFTVTLEFHATAEHVRVETVDEKRSAPSPSLEYDPSTDDPLD